MTKKIIFIFGFTMNIVLSRVAWSEPATPTTCSNYRKWASACMTLNRDKLIIFHPSWPGLLEKKPLEEGEPWVCQDYKDSHSEYDASQAQKPEVTQNPLLSTPCTAAGRHLTILHYALDEKKDKFAVFGWTCTVEK